MSAVGESTTKELTVDLPIVNSLVVDLPTADMKTGYSPVFDSVVNSLVVDSSTFDLQMDLMEP